MLYWQILILSTVSALALFFLARLLGYRQISELTVFDYINSITIGSIAAELAAADSWEGAARYAIALVVYAGFTWLLSLLCARFPRFRRYAVGETAVLMQKGHLIPENFCRAHMDPNDFLMQCRNAGYFDLAQIDTVYLEPNGRISIHPCAKERPVTPADLSLAPPEEEIPTPVVLCGRALTENLSALGFDMAWLSRQLATHGLDAAHTFLATATRQGTVWCSGTKAKK